MVKTLQNFFETNELISLKLGVKHRWLKYYIVYINHDTVMNLTGLLQGQHELTLHLNRGKLLKYHLEGQTRRKLANEQNIDYSEKKKKKMAQGRHLPLLWG